MEKHQCKGCGKTIELNKEVRFFELRLLEDEETYAPAEGYLCESCAEQRHLESSESVALEREPVPLRKGFFRRLFGG